jgi:hypothetical protein
MSVETRKESLRTIYMRIKWGRSMWLDGGLQGVFGKRDTIPTTI